MFRSIGNFLYRHKNKLFFGGGLIGGVIMLSRFAEYKLHKWHENETRLLVLKQQKRRHYEKTKEIANATVLNLSEVISKVICDELDTDTLLQALQSQPHNKKVLWEDLKLIGFGRCIVSVYTASFISAFAHIHLTLLSCYTNTNVESEQAAVDITSMVEETYMNLLQNVIVAGLPSMFKKIMYVLNKVVHPIALNKQISVEALESILRDIILLLEGEAIDNDLNTNHVDYKICPWGQYINDLKKTVGKNSEESSLNIMTEELVDIINTDDFNIVMQTLVHQGLNFVLDYVANFYPQPHLLACSHPSDETSSLVPDTDDKGAKPKQMNIESLNSANVSAKLNTVSQSSLPTAKLIPILSAIVHSSISTAPGHLLQSVLLNEKLENLSFNVYEAFSVI